MPLQINDQFKSNNHRDRKGDSVEFLVLHYTAVPLGTTLGIFTNNVALAEEDRKYFENSEYNVETLCKQEVSSHYVIAENGQIFNLVDETRAAYHAGVSFWNGKANINNQSIGVEHVNQGYQWLPNWTIPEERAIKVEGSDKTWCAFTEEQINQTIELCKTIIARYNIKPFNIVGHSDIACGRKQDPGPQFSWQRLAEAGIGIWYDLAESNLNEMPENYLELAKSKLMEFGYDCRPAEIKIDGITEEEKKEKELEANETKFKNVMQSFQMHFRPSNIDGIIDLECLQILDSLCQRKLNFELEATASLVEDKQPEEAASKNKLKPRF
jgi:N-acetylmuramoyl-L-alanine amidase